MNEKTKLKCAMLVELFVCIVMLISFLLQTELIFKFFNLFTAMMSLGFAFSRREELKRLIEDDISD